MKMVSKVESFQALASEVAGCNRCARMCGSVRVLNNGCGPLDATVMVIGEAPGRLGADSSGLPFHGDQAGHNFEELLRQTGLSRADVFITNAALCNPKDDKGNNATPKPAEILACSAFLKRQIDLIAPAFVVTLGGVALRAIENIESHSLTLRDAVRTKKEWYGRSLIPLYHPGQRAMIHRSFANQRSDYQFLSEQVRRRIDPARVTSGKARPSAVELAKSVLGRHGRISYFAFHKLVYLVEHVHWTQSKTRLTDAYFVRQKDGPYCVDLHPKRLQRAGLPIKVTSYDSKLFVELEEGLLLQQPPLEGAAGPLDLVFEKYSDLTDERLKTVTYLTSPMRRILKQEKLGANCFNSPIEFH